MTTPIKKVESLVLEALKSRGFSIGEARQIVDRLKHTKESNNSPPSRSFPMPMGKHKNVMMDKVDPSYLIWLIEQQWWKDQYAAFYEESLRVLRSLGFTF